MSTARKCQPHAKIPFTYLAGSDFVEEAIVATIAAVAVAVVVAVAAFESVVGAVEELNAHGAVVVVAAAAAVIVPEMLALFAILLPKRLVEVASPQRLVAPLVIMLMKAMSKAPRYCLHHYFLVEGLPKLIDSSNQFGCPCRCCFHHLQQLLLHYHPEEVG